MAEDVKAPVAEPSAAVATETKNPFASGKLTKEVSQQFAKEATPKTAEAAPAKSEGKPETATDSETVKEPQEKGSKKLSADERIAQLEATIEKIKKGKGEPKQAEEAKQAEPSAAKPAEVKPAPAPKQLVEPKEPDMGDPKYAGTEGWEKYTADVSQYTKDLAKYESAKAIEDYKRGQVQEQQAARVKAEFEAAEKKYGDFNEKTKPLVDILVAEASAAPEAKTIMPAVLDAIASNPLCADILYVLGPQKDEFLALAKSNPLAAIEKVGVIKHLISEEFAAKKEAKPEAEPKETKESPVKTKTEELQPTKEVGSRGTGPTDPVADSVRRANGKLTKELSDQWTRKAAERFHGS